MIFSTFVLLLPLFLIIGAGYLFARFYAVGEASLIAVLTDFFMPMLVFVSLYRSTITPLELGRLFGATSTVVVIMLLLAVLYARIVRIDPKSFALPVIFMNSGFLGIPLMQIWGGSEAMNIIIIFDEIQTLYIFTLGLVIIRGGVSKKAIKASLSSPILWAVIAGFGANVGGLPIPHPILDTCAFAGDAAPPLAAFTLGLSIHARKPQLEIHLFAGILLRIVAGFLTALLVVTLFGFSGTARTVLLVTGALPAALFSYVLPSRYGIDSRRAQGIVIATTMLSIIIIPVAFAIAQAL
ncbi:AEC family transporter [Sediminispirochaeta bajacaliforniensis]|uniref:AEC family transporter n=1 Tax=Sediminispirochaeta bajacaliforniensis TaxID=148 RepID=UPI00037C11AE|nr:AEC family transporter [Sediminispirochaeta bajacaliforniensis]